MPVRKRVLNEKKLVWLIQKIKINEKSRFGNNLLTKIRTSSIYFYKMLLVDCYTLLFEYQQINSGRMMCKRDLLKRLMDSLLKN